MINRQGSQSPTAEEYSPDYVNYLLDVSTLEEDRPPDYDAVVPPANQRVSLWIFFGFIYP